VCVSSVRRLPCLALAIVAGLLGCATLFAVLGRPPPARAAGAGTTHDFPGCGATIQACINTAADGDTIRILTGTYQTTLVLTRPVSLTGVSSAAVILRAPEFQRVLSIGGASISGSVVISGLTMVDGFGGAQGGGIWIGGNASPLLANLVISGSSAQLGGGVYAAANSLLRLQDVTLMHNTAITGGGAYAAGSANLAGGQVLTNTASAGRGGGVYVAGDSVINAGLFQANQCTAVGCRGGGLYVSGTLALTGTQFISNASLHLGGGAATDGPAALTGALFRGNSANAGGGLAALAGVALTGTDFISNTVDSEGGGAGIMGQATVIGGLFQGNQCTQSNCGAGGLLAFPALALTGTRFIANSAQGSAGGVFASSDLILLGSHGASILPAACASGPCAAGGPPASDRRVSIANAWFVANSAGTSGGGLAHALGEAEVVNTLFAGNQAGQGGAAVLVHTASQFRLLHATIASAPASSGSAMLVVSDGAIAVTNTLFSGYAIGLERQTGSAAEDYNLFSGPGLPYSGTVNSGGNSLNGAAGFANPAAGDFRLGPGSDAIDRGTNAGVVFDAFGAPRPIGPGFDIGFHEFDPVRRLYLPLVMR
jgi:hypothetical protein